MVYTIDAEKPKGHKTLNTHQGHLISEGKGFFIGLDLGKKRDYSAIVVVERIYDNKQEDSYRHVVRKAHRYKPGGILSSQNTHYTDLVKDVLRRYVNNPNYRVEEEYRPVPGGFREWPMLILDATGIGNRVEEDFINAGLRSNEFKRVIITGGNQVTRPGGPGVFGVPKSKLYYDCYIDAENDRLQVAEGMEELDILQEELKNIRPKERKDNGPLTYEEIREDKHDDLVVAMALAHWAAHRFSPAMRYPIDLPPDVRGSNLAYEIRSSNYAAKARQRQSFNWFMS